VSYSPAPSFLLLLLGILLLLISYFDKSNIFWEYQEPNPCEISKSDLNDYWVVALLRKAYGLHTERVEFLHSGADFNTMVYGIDSFLNRRGLNHHEI
jgi:hypothetical protein